MSTLPPRSRPSKAPERNSTRATRIAASLLIAAMLAVPIALLVVGRRLVPDIDRLRALFATAPVERVEPSSEGVARPPEGPPPWLRGSVVDGEGAPVGGAAVRLVAAGPGVHRKAPFEVFAEVTTDALGTFSFVEPRAADVPLRIVAVHGTDGVGSSAELRTAAGEAPEVVVVLSAREKVRGNVVDEGGHPVPGAQVSVAAMPWAAVAVASDESGAFELTTVPHEAESLAVAARGYADAHVSLEARQRSTEPAELAVRVQLVTLPPVMGDVTDVDGNGVAARVVACEGETFEARATSAADGTFELPSTATGCGVTALHEAFGASETRVAVTGKRLALRLSPGGSIDGVVVDERGSRVASFTVGVEGFAAARGKSVRGGGERKTFEDTSGEFHLEHLAPGTYVLTASAPDKTPTRSDPVDVKSGGATAGVRIVLSAGGVVVGHVYDEKHAPIAGVDLRFDQVSSVVASGANTKTDDRGAFRLEGAPAGLFTLRAQKDGFRLRMVAGLHVSPGTPLTQEVTLTAAAGGANLELGGIGATVEQTREGIVFRSVFSGDPADQAGLRGGDLVVRIDGESTDGMSVADALQRLRGEAGTTVGISIQRSPPPGPNGAPLPNETVDTLVTRALVVH